MREFNFNVYLENIDSDIKKAQSLISDIEHYRQYSSIESNMFDDEKHDLDEMLLEDYISRSIIKIRFALEYLNLNILLQDFNKMIEKFETYHNELYYVPYIGVLSNSVLEEIEKYVSALRSQSIFETKESKLQESQNLLQQILVGTPKIIADNNIEPKNEKEVRNAVYKLLIHVFPDTVREIPISKVSKVYRPDIGIKKLKTAIEYKFADSEQEMKKCIGGIFEDIKGYEGSEDWKTFYAVIYQTGHFMMQSQINEEFELSKVGSHWKPILVYGKGERIKK